MQQYQNQCPHCPSTNIVKNGRTYYGKQNHKCKPCKRQFVTPKLGLKETVKKLLLERISLRGICRVVGKSLGWLMYFLQKVFEELRKQLPKELPDEAQVDLLRLEADEMWSFVGEKSNKEWLWLAMERKTRQMVAYWIGPRDEEGALGLWFSIPKSIWEKAHFFTDNWDAYACVIEKEQLTQGKKEGNTNHQERLITP